MYNNPLFEKNLENSVQSFSKLFLSQIKIYRKYYVNLGFFLQNVSFITAGLQNVFITFNFPKND